MRTLPVEAAPVCAWCQDGQADPMFGRFCSGTCEDLARDEEQYGPARTCSYCGDPCEGRWCSVRCRQADESEHA